MAIQSKSQLRRLRNSFRQNLRQTTRNLQEFGQAVHDSNLKQEVRARLRRVPNWVKIVRKIYHKYGLKHLLLIMVFVLYQFMGACVFLFLEEKAEEDKETKWKSDVLRNRTDLIDMLMNSFFNNSHYLFYLTPEESAEIYGLLNEQLTNYTANYKQMTDQKIQWDFWNAMLYAGTVCTTIGYGHLFPRTNAGRFATMVYAIFGIPLVFMILDDLGKLLTLGLKYPWLGCKMLIRRVFRHCTGQSLAEIRRIDQEDKKWLPVFDLPIPVAIGVVVAWIFICSATFCIWEQSWDYFIAFYFFFVSLTTIGLGDIVPSQPKYLLMLFGYIIVGLSLVSMCVNLIQAKLERTYEAGREEAEMTDADGESVLDHRHHHQQQQHHLFRRARTPPPFLPSSRRPSSTGGGGGGGGGPTGAVATLALTAASRVSLGVLRANSISTFSLSSTNTRSPVRAAARRHHFHSHQQQQSTTSNKICQTVLSIGPGSLLSKHSGDLLIPPSHSLDDVMKLVDTEETDFYILSQLCGDKSEANLVQNIDQDDEWQSLLASNGALDQPPSGSQHQHQGQERVDLHRQPSTVSGRVHFRSPVSLIPRHHSSTKSHTFISLADHVASLARMDSSSLKSPSESADLEVGVGGGRGSVSRERTPEPTVMSPVIENGSPSPTVVTHHHDRPSTSSATAAIPRPSLLAISEPKKRKTSFVDMLRKRFSHSSTASSSSSQQPSTSFGGKTGGSNLPLASGGGIEEVSGDEDDDNDRTPLDPKLPKRP